MLSRIENLFDKLLQGLLQPQPVPVPVARHEGLPPNVRRALAQLDERHARGEISDAEYVRRRESLLRR